MESKEHTPAIVVTEIGDCISTWNEVLLGIEEEGIPFRIQHIPSGEVIDSAWQAARKSPLLVGIACDREKLIVHYKNLPASALLFTLMYQQRCPPGKRHSLQGMPLIIHRRNAV